MAKLASWLKGGEMASLCNGLAKKTRMVHNDIAPAAKSRRGQNGQEQLRKGMNRAGVFSGADQRQQRISAKSGCTQSAAAAWRSTLRGRGVACGGGHPGVASRAPGITSCERRVRRERRGENVCAKKRHRQHRTRRGVVMRIDDRLNGGVYRWDAPWRAQAARRRWLFSRGRGSALRHRRDIDACRVWLCADRRRCTLYAHAAAYNVCRTCTRLVCSWRLFSLLAICRRKR